MYLSLRNLKCPPMVLFQTMNFVGDNAALAGGFAGGMLIGLAC